MPSSIEKLVLVTRKTRLEMLTERFNTRAQAKFYLDQAGLDFDDYAREHDTYRRSLDATRGLVELGLPVQLIERALAPTYLFSPTDAVVVLGQDGTVANVAKYVGDCPLLGVNPDPERFDGVLLPFRLDALRKGLAAVLNGNPKLQHVTLAEAKLSDGQVLRAFNDLFIGARTHVSAHYKLRPAASGSTSLKMKSVSKGTDWERQSSSGVIVSTGAGSTGWLSSVCSMASGMSQALGGKALGSLRFAWDAREVRYVVREPFVSKFSSANNVTGTVGGTQSLDIESLMPSGGVIFSDG
ncbi:MAG: NAD(+)/NADH kinase, partial [Archangium sp.]|nr:NAD(+)/NADH kinase [Archangium sp.]